MEKSPFLGDVVCFIFLFLIQFFVFFGVNAQQYYDAKYRRYVFIGDEPEKIKTIRNSIQGEQGIKEPEKSVTNVEAYRRFDPNRYHNSEEIEFL
jgi:hypothetical protein